jgi:hypothetical protein
VNFTLSYLNKLQKLLITLLILINIQCTPNDLIQEREMSILEVIHPELQQILTSYIEHEKRCSYYSDELIFHLLFYEYENVIEVHISSSNIYPIVYQSNEYGVLLHHHHLIIVQGIYVNDLFNDTDKTRILKFYNSDRMTWEELYDLADDDESYTFWVYKYVNNEFVLYGKQSFCD